MSMPHFTALFICISFIIFAARVFDREWIFGWQSNYLSWSFALAVGGGILLWICGALFLIEGRRAAYADERGDAITVVHRQPQPVLITSEPTKGQQTGYVVTTEQARKTHPEMTSVRIHLNGAKHSTSAYIAPYT